MRLITKMAFHPFFTHAQPSFKMKTVCIFSWCLRCACEKQFDDLAQLISHSQGDCSLVNGPKGSGALQKKSTEVTDPRASTGSTASIAPSMRSLHSPSPAPPSSSSRRSFSHVESIQSSNSSRARIMTSTSERDRGTGVSQHDATDNNDGTLLTSGAVAAHIAPPVPNVAPATVVDTSSKTAFHLHASETLSRSSSAPLSPQTPSMRTLPQLPVPSSSAVSQSASGLLTLFSPPQISPPMHEHERMLFAGDSTNDAVLSLQQSASESSANSTQSTTLPPSKLHGDHYSVLTSDAMSMMSAPMHERVLLADNLLPHHSIATESSATSVQSTNAVPTPPSKSLDHYSAGPRDAMSMSSSKSANYSPPVNPFDTPSHSSPRLSPSLTQQDQLVSPPLTRPPSIPDDEALFDAVSPVLSQTEGFTPSGGNSPLAVDLAQFGSALDVATGANTNVPMTLPSSCNSGSAFLGVPDLSNSDSMIQARTSEVALTSSTNVGSLSPVNQQLSDMNLSDTSLSITDFSISSTALANVNVTLPYSNVLPSLGHDAPRTLSTVSSISTSAVTDHAAPVGFAPAISSTLGTGMSPIDSFTAGSLHTSTAASHAESVSVNQPSVISAPHRYIEVDLSGAEAVLNDEPLLRTASMSASSQPGSLLGHHVSPVRCDASLNNSHSSGVSLIAPNTPLTNVADSQHDQSFGILPVPHEAQASHAIIESPYTTDAHVLSQNIADHTRPESPIAVSNSIVRSSSQTSMSSETVTSSASMRLPSVGELPTDFGDSVFSETSDPLTRL